jgi:hypothetical protein
MADIPASPNAPVVPDLPEGTAMVEEGLSELALGPQDIELRESLKWQCVIVDAIFEYMDTVPAAFESIMRAHEKLEQSGILIRDTAPDSMPLLDRLREATTGIAEVVQAARQPLRTIRGTLHATFDDVNQSDGALSELRHYCQKVDKLTGECNNSVSLDGSENIFEKDHVESRALVLGKLGNISKKDSKNSDLEQNAKVTRNLEKLQTWLDEAHVRQARCRDILKACNSRQEGFLQTVRDIFCSVVRGIGVASGCAPTVENEMSSRLTKPPPGSPLVYKFTIAPCTAPMRVTSAIAEECDSRQATDGGELQSGWDESLPTEAAETRDGDGAMKVAKGEGETSVTSLGETNQEEWQGHFSWPVHAENHKINKPLELDVLSGFTSPACTPQDVDSSEGCGLAPST